jgi:hypothetical protein
MKLVGLSKIASPHLAVSASHFVDLSHLDPNWAAS